MQAGRDYEPCFRCGGGLRKVDPVCPECGGRGWNPTLYGCVHGFVGLMLLALFLFAGLDWLVEDLHPNWMFVIFGVLLLAAVAVVLAPGQRRGP